MADPLEIQAKVWVERWLDRGGSVIVGASRDTGQIAMSLDTPAKHRGGVGDHILWHDGCHVGHWRELEELVRVVPGLREAVIHHVALNGHLYACGTTAMQVKAA
jgi:hypothetical protein